LQEIEERHKKDLDHEIEPSTIPVLARLLDLSAAFTVHYAPSTLSTEEKERLKRLARVMVALREAKWDEARANLLITLPSQEQELDRLEHSLTTLVRNYSEGGALLTDAHPGDEPLAVPSKRWLAADCFTNPEHAFFSFKVALCAMLCFVVYDALVWPGISTSVITIMVASLSSSGATNQKLLYRFLGSALGGIVFGLGSIVFIFPYTDSMVTFLIVSGLVTFIGAWVIRSPHYGYIGLQIAFSYYLVVFTGFSAPTQMAPATNRLIGILLALIVLMLVFRPEKSVDKMKEEFARLLSVQADFLHASAPHLPVSIRRMKAMELKNRMEAIVSSARGYTELITYELSQHRAEHMQSAENIEQAMLNSGNLLLSVSSWPLETTDTAQDHGLDESRDLLERGLRSLAAALDNDGESGVRPGKDNAHLLSEIPGTAPSYISNSAEIYRELQKQCFAITSCS
jgi:multidrug resistance protein MdtO